MSDLLTFIHGTAVTAGAATALYAFTVTVVALTAAFSSESTRRRAAREVLAILLRRRD